MSSMNDATDATGTPTQPVRKLAQSAWQFLLVLGLAAIAIGVIALCGRAHAPGRRILFGIYLL